MKYRQLSQRNLEILQIYSFIFIYLQHFIYQYLQLLTNIRNVGLNIYQILLSELPANDHLKNYSTK
jgi:hypothetical protein